jgi:hypothetical protein
VAAAQKAGRRLRRLAGLQADHDVEPHPSAVDGRVLAADQPLRVEWHCDIERPSNLRTEEHARRHADDRERDAFDDERRANDARVAAETPLPHPIADDRHLTIPSATTYIVGGRNCGRIADTPAS